VAATWSRLQTASPACRCRRRESRRNFNAGSDVWRLFLQRGFSFDFFLGSAAPFLALWLSLSRLNSVLAHRERPVHSVEFVVETAGIAHRLAIVVSPPEGGSGGSTICAAESHASRGRSEHAAREVNQRSVHPVHLVVQPAGVAKVMACPITSPKGSRYGSTVYTLSAFAKVVAHLWIVRHPCPLVTLEGGNVVGVPCRVHHVLCISGIRIQRM